MAQLGQSAPDLRPAKDRRYKIRTGAKTASKAQQRELLERFKRLADDTTAVLPRWTGSGTRNPFEKLRKALNRVGQASEDPGQLRKLAKKRTLAGAAAATIMISRRGKVASYATLPVGTRTVRFVPSGQTKRHHLVAVQNHDDPEARMIGFIDYARKSRASFWVVGNELIATPAGSPPPEGFGRGVLEAGGMAPDEDQDGACRHAAADAFHVATSVQGVATPIRACAECLGRVEGRLDGLVGRRHLAKAKRPKTTFRLGGVPFQPQTQQTRNALTALIGQADEATRIKAKRFDDVTAKDYLAWGLEQVRELLGQHAGGHLLAGEELWLDDWAAAATKYADSEAGVRILQAAFEGRPLHVETRDPTLTKILQGAWPQHGRQILQAAAAGSLDADRARTLAALEPAEAARRLDEAVAVQDRLAAFPRYDLGGVAPALAFLIEAAHGFHGSGPAAVAQMTQVAATQPERKIAALAAARAVGAADGVEWRFTPDEKRAADFLVPYANAMFESDPQTFHDALAQAAVAVGTNAPVPRKD